MATIPYFAIHQKVDEELDLLIADMQAIVDDTEVYQDGSMGKAQFSNLSGVARETDSVPVVINWIRYQIGRSKQNQAWCRPSKRQQSLVFGEQLIYLIEQYRGRAAELAEDISDRDTFTATSRAVWIALVRQLAGQLERYIVYQRTMKGIKDRE